MLPKISILNLIAQHQILLLDGAMGTSIGKYGKQKPNELQNIVAPEIVGKTHTDFLNAGATIITTNTFCANGIDLQNHNLQYKVEEINKLAVQIAKKSIVDYQKKSANRPCFIAASVGPTSINLSQHKKVTFKQMVSNYQQQIAVLLSQNIDLLLLETVMDMENLKALFAALDFCDNRTTVAVSFAVGSNYKSTYLGAELKPMIELVEQRGVDILGVNCANNITLAVEATRYVKTLTQLPIMLYPNTGSLKQLSAVQFSNNLHQLINKKQVQIVGGCCGTTPEHIAALQAIVMSCRDNL